MSTDKLSDLDNLILEEARNQQIRFPPANSEERLNFVNFVKAFSLDVMHDSSIQKQLLEPSEH